MPEEFEFKYTDDFDVVAQRDDSGNLYVERNAITRGFWAVLGLAVAAGAGYYAFVIEGSEGWVLSTATPAVVALLAFLGVVAEYAVGSDRSAVHEEAGEYTLEMMPSSRMYVGAAAVAALMAGVSVVLSVRAPGVVDSTGRGRGLAAMAESIPFGDLLLLAVAAAIAGWLLSKAIKGRMPIEHKRSYEVDMNSVDSL